MLWPRWIWLRALGLIFLSAFYSLAFQITGLIGPRGILPAGEYLAVGFFEFDAAKGQLTIKRPNGERVFTKEK